MQVDADNVLTLFTVEEMLIEDWTPVVPSTSEETVGIPESEDSDVDDPSYEAPNNSSEEGDTDNIDAGKERDFFFFFFY